MHAIELPRELAAVPISVLRVSLPKLSCREQLAFSMIKLTGHWLQAYLSDVLLQVLQALYPGADVTPARVQREMDILLSASFAQLSSFTGAAALGHGLPLSANLQQATNTSLELYYQHDCL